MPRVKKFFKCSFFFCSCTESLHSGTRSKVVPNVSVWSCWLLCFPGGCSWGCAAGTEPWGGGYSTWAVHNPAARSAWHHPRACDALPPSSSELSDTWEAVSFSIPSGPRLHNGVMGAGGHCWGERCVQQLPSHQQWSSHQYGNRRRLFLRVQSLLIVELASQGNQSQTQRCAWAAPPGLHPTGTELITGNMLHWAASSTAHVLILCCCWWWI